MTKKNPSHLQAQVEYIFLIVIKTRGNIVGSLWINMQLSVYLKNFM